MERTQARLRLTAAVSSTSRRASSPLVHRQQVISAKVIPFPAKRRHQRRPVVLRNTPAFLPFLDHRSVLTDINGHRGKRVPGIKDVIKSAHVAEYASDELSVQEPTMIPMTNPVALRTISPMGRGVTPVRFRNEMAKRLRSARVVAGYATQKQAADALQIGLDRYEKWETGRTPIPAQYIGPICALYGIDANYLYDIEARPRARESA